MLGIDLGETEVRLGVLNLRGRLVVSEHQPLIRSNGRVDVGPLLDRADDLARQHGVAGAGVAVPGRLDQASSTVLRAVNLGWRDVPLLASVEKKLGLPVVLERTAEASLMAEDWWGSAPSGDPFVFVRAGSGVSSAIKAHGWPLRGASDEAGLLGHIVADPNGSLCACGRRGCLETVASAAAALSRYQDLHRQAGTTSSLTNTRLTIDSVMAASAEDPLAREALEQVADHLGRGLVTLVNLINPQVIVLGGELMDAQSIVLPRVRKIVEDEGLPRADVDIVCQSFGDEAALIGAATLAFDRLFTSPSRDWGIRDAKQRASASTL